MCQNAETRHPCCIVRAWFSELTICRLEYLNRKSRTLSKKHSDEQKPCDKPQNATGRGGRGRELLLRDSDLLVRVLFDILASFRRSWMVAARMEQVVMRAPEHWTWTDMFQWTYVGVDHKLPGNGGPACADFTGVTQRLVETAIFSAIGLLEALLAARRLTLPARIRRPGGDEHPHQQQQQHQDWALGRLLLAVLCLTFGVEIGFKFATGQLIWLLNPCHVVSIIQVGKFKRLL